MRRDSFNVLFFIKKTKLQKNGEASVCMRITVNGASKKVGIESRCLDIYHYICK